MLTVVSLTLQEELRARTLMRRLHRQHFHMVFFHIWITPMCLTTAVLLLELTLLDLLTQPSLPRHLQCQAPQRTEHHATHLRHTTYLLLHHQSDWQTSLALKLSTVDLHRHHYLLTHIPVRCLMTCSRQ
jgi:hypothetical protein